MSEICNTFANHIKLAYTSDAGKQVGIPSDYKKNKTEKVGSFLLVPVRNVPNAINASSRAFRFCAKGALNATSRTLDFCTKTAMNPQVIVVVLTATPILVGSHYLYREYTTDKVINLSEPIVNATITALETAGTQAENIMTVASKAIQGHLGTIKEVTKFVAFAGSAATVIGVGARYCGRITQEQIKNAFYAKPNADTKKV